MTIIKLFFSKCLFFLGEISPLGDKKGLKKPLKKIGEKNDHICHISS
jgi:hypothetical protein